MSSCFIIIPALNEEKSIGKVLQNLPKTHYQKVIVVNNGSTDNTVPVAEKNGAVVLTENRRGYGQACLCGLDYVARLPDAEKPDMIAFIDADFSDDPSELPLLLEPIENGAADMVIGSRALGKSERGSMTIPQVFGNLLATQLIHLFYKVKFTDLGPFRAIRYSALLELDMQDTNYGWTVEMQIKAAKAGIKSQEVPVSYRRRIGKSKISGTIKGTFLAGSKILWKIYECR